MNFAAFHLRPLRGPGRQQVGKPECTRLVRTDTDGRPRGWLARMEAWLWRARQREIEQRLAGSVSAAELEARMGAFERVSPLRRYD